MARKRQKREKKVVLKLPLDILPIEIWELAFNNLPVKDVITCTHTTQAWRNFYQDKRTSLLMEVAFPFISKYLRNEDIMSSRKVCRPWRNGVDWSLQNHPVHYDIRLYDNTERVATPTLDIANCFTPANMQKFERLTASTDLGQSVSNPFAITRHLSYEEYHSRHQHFDTMNHSHQRRVLSRLLYKFGSQLWHCRLIIYRDESPSDLYRWVRGLLHSMPNLKSLSFFHAGNDPPQYFGMVPSLQDLVRNEPFPELNHLVKLCSDIGDIVEFGALQRFTNLRKVYCATSLRSFPSHFQDQRLNYLEELHTTLDNYYDIQKLHVIFCPLKVLKLNVKTGTLDFTTVFRAVSHFGLNLKHFALHLKEYNHDYELPSIQEMLELPKLETLKIVAGKNHFKNLDCVLHCTSLKKLKIQVKVSNLSNVIRRRTGGTIQFAGYEDCMHKSNIWRLLPKLENLQVTTTTFVTGCAPKEIQYNYKLDPKLQDTFSVLCWESSLS